MSTTTRPPLSGSPPLSSRSRITASAALGAALLATAGFALRPDAPTGRSAGGALTLPPGAGYVANAAGLNTRGQVVGTAAARGRGPTEVFEIEREGSGSPGCEVTKRGYTDRAFLWQNGKMSALPTPERFLSSFGKAVSARGDVAGFVCEPRDRESGGVAVPRAAVWVNGRLTLIHAYDGEIFGTWSRADDVNDRGEVVGTASSSGDDTEGFLWASGRARSLRAGTLAFSQANAINNRGQVVGFDERNVISRQGNEQTTRFNVRRALLWEDGRIRILPTPATATFADAYDINDHGQVVGYALLDSATARGVVWEAEGRLRVLAPLPGDTRTTALTINNRGEILGTSERDVPAGAARTRIATRVVLWSPNGRVRVIRTPAGYPDADFRALNDAGQIAGSASRDAVPARAFLLDGIRATDLGSLLRASR